MNLVVRSRTPLNSWPAFVDAMIALVLMIIFTIMVFFVSNTQWVQELYVTARQQRVKQAIESQFHDEIEKGTIWIEHDGNLQRISFSNNLLFLEAQKELREDGGVELLKRLRDVFEEKIREDPEIFQQVDIEAHADPRPLQGNSEYKTNWDLSVARAAEVVKFFVGDEEKARLRKAWGLKTLLDPALFAATGYSLFRPPEEAKKYGNAYFRGTLDDHELELIYSEARRMDVLITYSTDFPE